MIMTCPQEPYDTLEETEASDAWWDQVRQFGPWSSAERNVDGGYFRTQNEGFKVSWNSTNPQVPTIVVPLTAEAELWLMLNPHPFGEIREGPIEVGA